MISQFRGKLICCSLLLGIFVLQGNYSAANEAFVELIFVGGLLILTTGSGHPFLRFSFVISLLASTVVIDTRELLDGEQAWNALYWVSFLLSHPSGRMSLLYPVSLVTAFSCNYVFRCRAESDSSLTILVILESVLWLSAALAFASVYVPGAMWCLKYGSAYFRYTLDQDIILGMLLIEGIRFGLLCFAIAFIQRYLRQNPVAAISLGLVVILYSPLVSVPISMMSSLVEPYTVFEALDEFWHNLTELIFLLLLFVFPLPRAFDKFGLKQEIEP
jgi:hypothetical protein